MKLLATATGIVSRYFVKILILFLLTLGGFGILSGKSFFKQALSGTRSNEKITDISRYQEIRNQLWSNKSQIQHFPNDVPKSSREISLVYSQGYLKGGNFLQLRVKEPLEKIKNLQTNYRKQAKYKFQGGDTNDHINRKNGVPTTYFYTSGTDDYYFPATYEILVLNASDKGGPGNKWVKGSSSGVAIDADASEIVYWVEEW